jgi:hypothetical protein
LNVEIARFVNGSQLMDIQLAFKETVTTSASVMESKSDLAFTIFLIYHLLSVNF